MYHRDRYQGVGAVAAAAPAPRSAPAPMIRVPAGTRSVTRVAPNVVVLRERRPTRDIIPALGAVSTEVLFDRRNPPRSVSTGGGLTPMPPSWSGSVRAPIRGIGVPSGQAGPIVTFPTRPLAPPRTAKTPPRFSVFIPPQIGSGIGTPVPIQVAPAPGTYASGSGAQSPANVRPGSGSNGGALTSSSMDEEDDFEDEAPEAPPAPAAPAKAPASKLPFILAGAAALAYFVFKR